MTGAAEIMAAPGGFVVGRSGLIARNGNSFTCLLVPAEFSDKSNLKAMKDFPQWMSTDGQRLTEELQHAPSPKEVVAKEQAAFSKVH